MQSTFTGPLKFFWFMVQQRVLKPIMTKYGPYLRCDRKGTLKKFRELAGKEVRVALNVKWPSSN